MPRISFAGPEDADRSPLDDADASTWVDRRATKQAQRAARARQASRRRRSVDPSTCNRDYSAAEMEFLRAMQEYKTTSGRTFPSWREVLQVVERLGYRKIVPDGPSSAPAV